jgi:hypothetical protein
MNNAIQHFFRPVIVIGLLASTLVNAAEPTRKVEPFTAVYQATAWGMQVPGQMSLVALDGNRWQYSLSVSNPIGELSQQTIFDVQGDWLRPLSSNDMTRVLFNRRSVQTQYDWNQRQARWSGDVKPDRAGPVALQDGDMDALLINLVAVHDISNGHTPSYRMVENGKDNIDLQIQSWR